MTPKTDHLKSALVCSDILDLMIGISIGSMGHVVLRVLGVAEEEITETQAFVVGLVVFAIFILIVTVLANFA